MISIKENKIVVDAVVVGVEAGEPIRLMVGDLFFERRLCPVLKAKEDCSADLNAEASKKRAYHRIGADKGALVMRMKGNPIYKNVLDDARKARTWSELRPVIQKYYPNYNDGSVQVAMNLYKRALVKGVPSVPLSEITSQERAGGFQRTVERKKGGKRPEGAIFFDKGLKIWVKQSDYDMVLEHCRSVTSFHMKDLLNFFVGRLKFHTLKAVIHKLQEEKLVVKRSGGKHIWTYYPVNVGKPAVATSFPENLVAKVDDGSKALEGITG